MLNRIWTLTKLTFKEMSSKKIIWAFFGISIFILLIMILVFNTFDVEEILPIVKMKNKNQEMDIMFLATRFFKTAVAMPMFIGGLFLSIFAVSSLIPTILEKGTVDFFLSRPIKREEIIIGEFLGGSSLVIASIAFLITGTWTLIGLYLGNWDLSFFAVIPLSSLAFLNYFALLILFGVLWQNSISAMMFTYFIFFAVSPILQAHETILIFLEGPIWESVIMSLYYIFPQSSELVKITSQITTNNYEELTLFGSTTVSIWITILQTFAYLLISVLLFKKKEY